MANIANFLTKILDNGAQDVYLVTWPAMGGSDMGVAAPMAGAADRTVQVEGTFGGATVVFQGSNDGSNYETLTDPQGNLLSWTSGGIKQVLQLTRYVQPVTTGGGGSSINVNLLLKGQR